MKSVVLKLSGHIFDDDNLIDRYIKTIRGYVETHPDVKLIVVTGGGRTARRYTELVRKYSNNEAMADLAGILASRLNALTIISGLGEYVYSTPPENVTQFLQALSTNKRVIVCGGLQPGQSTATVAMILAELSGSREVIFCSNVDAVYTDDPRRNPNAKRLEKVTVSELLEILKRSADIRAGTYQLIDQWALLIAKRAGITIYVVDGSKPELVPDVLDKKTGYGTVIIPD